MGFWLFMLAMDLLIPLVMLGFGLRFRKAPPEKINRLFGYRTARSMRSREAWDYAHQLLGRLWVRWGAVMLPLSLLAMVPVLGRDTDTVSCCGTVVCLLQTVPLVLTVVPVERALKEKFGD